MVIKLLICGLVIAGALAYAVYLGASSGWQYYLHVDEFVKSADQFAGRRVRLSGRIARGSLAIATEKREVRFVLEGEHDKLPIYYRGALPENLAEGRDVLVEGSAGNAGPFRCETLITRCASKYASKSKSEPQTTSTQGGTE
jgi:cytochrome c-type biogenesis protein CcmE